MMNKVVLLVVLLATLILANQTMASSEINFSGFGQIVGGTISGDADTVYGYDSDISFTEESLFGLQVNARVNDRVSATAQLIGRGQDDFSPEFAWAYLTYQFTDQWSLRAGRIRLPVFRYSDFLDVGYAFHWTRTPSSVYGVLDFSEIDGLNFSHTAFLGDWFSRAQFVYGRFKGDVTIAGESSPTDLTNVFGGAWELNRDWFTARAAYFSAEVDIRPDGLQPLLMGLNAAGFGDVASQIAFEGDTGTFWGIALGGDWDDYFVSGEFVNRKVDDTLLNDSEAWYVSAGWRINDWTLHTSFGSLDGKPQTAALENLPADFPLFGPVQGLLLGQESRYDFYGVGARWDIRSNLAAKFDFERRDVKAGGEDANVFSAGLVFTF